MPSKKRKDRRIKTSPRKCNKKSLRQDDESIGTNTSRQMEPQGMGSNHPNQSDHDQYDDDGESAALCFQDCMDKYTSAGNEGDDVSLVFFELANAPYIRYRIKAETGGRCNDVSEKIGTTAAPSLPSQLPLSPLTSSSFPHSYITIRQDLEGACGEHTGGIVWETSYLLCEYLLQMKLHSTNPTLSLGRTCEVGAGCGLTGQVLHRASLVSEMVMTECLPVLSNLQSNLQRNQTSSQSSISTSTLASVSESCSSQQRDLGTLRTTALDWTNYERDVKNSRPHLQPHIFDTILGTDVVFCPTLVEPLLASMRYLAHDKTVAYLCLQERCVDSYRLLFERASKYGWKIEDISKQVYEHQDYKGTLIWGQELDCKLLHFTTIVGRS